MMRLVRTGGTVAFALAMVGSVATLAAGNAQAALTITVAPNTADSSATCAASPCPNLRAAVTLANANPGSTISLQSGTYVLKMSELIVTSNVTISGQGPRSTKVQQTSPGQVIEITTTGAPVVTLQGFEVTGGNNIATAGTADSSLGGGIESSSAGTLTLRNMLIDHNTVQGGSASAVTGSTTGIEGGEASGGGVYTFPSPVVIDHSTITDNTATGGRGGDAENGHGGFGGTVYGAGVEAGGALTVEDSTISANTGLAGNGGDANTIAGTGGDADGGGLDAAAYAAPTTIERSTIAGNWVTAGSGGMSLSFGGDGGDTGSASGGGLFLRSAVVVNSTVTGNEADGGTPGPGSGGGSSGAGVAPFGGGLFDNAMDEMTVASDTFAGNIADPADVGAGGNIYVNSLAPMMLVDTIVTGGSAASGGNCSGAVSDRGHNLEDTMPSQCGLSPADHDLIGAKPGLGALAANGGPTQTLALGGSSPALGAGGACADPGTMGNPRLAIDQRSLPRPSTCDIGAFQHQPPTSTARPTIGGIPGVGRTLGCNRGAWSGDSPVAFTYRWLRDGATVAGATTAMYTPLAGDAGHSLACRVTAQNIYAAASAVSAAVAVPPRPTLTKVGESHRVWRERAAAGHHAPRGTTFRFTLNTPATVTLTIERCAHRHRCTTMAGKLGLAAAHAGINRIAFDGLLAKHRRLSPGRYEAVLSAANDSGRARSRGLSFTVV
jgi:hypothetical protein